MMSMSIVLTLLLSLLAGFLPLPLPWSLPPLPENPALLRAVPADAVLFVQWHGTAPTADQTRNRTERLLAEPELLELRARALSALRATFTAGAGEHAATVAESVDLVARALARPGCAFLGPIDPRRPGDVGAAVIAELGDGIEEATRTMRKLESLAALALPQVGAETAQPPSIDGVQFRALSLHPQAPRILWAACDGHLVIALGEALPASIVAGLRGGAGKSLADNPRFAALRDATTVARPATRSFVDFAAILDKLGGLLGERERALLKALGVTDLQGLYTTGGLDGDGFAMRTTIGLREASGPFAWLGKQPIGRADLAIVPADADLALALRLDPLTVLQGALAVIEAIEPGARAGFERDVSGPLQAATGLRLEQDLLAPLGDCITAWNAPSQGGLLGSGATLAIAIDDPATFQPAFERLMAHFADSDPKRNDESGRRQRGVFLEQTRFGAHTAWFLNTIGDDFPLAPAWCATDRHLLVSFFPQPIKAAVRRGPDVETSLARHALLAGDERAAALLFADERRLFDQVYPLLHPLGQLLVSELQHEGTPLDITALPTAGAIRPHLVPSLLEVRRTEVGWQVVRRGTLPALDPLLGPALPLFGLRAIFAYERVRAAEMRARTEAERRGR
jgi:hypothetical protein